MPAPALTLLLWLLAVGSARAGEVEEAEARRISVELKERVTEARWEAADDLYRRLRLLRNARLRRPAGAIPHALSRGDGKDPPRHVPADVG